MPGIIRLFFVDILFLGCIRFRWKRRGRPRRRRQREGRFAAAFQSAVRIFNFQIKYETKQVRRFSCPGARCVHSGRRIQGRVCFSIRKQEVGVSIWTCQPKLLVRLRKSPGNFFLLPAVRYHHNLAATVGAFTGIFIIDRAEMMMTEWHYYLNILYNTRARCTQLRKIFTPDNLCCSSILPKSIDRNFKVFLTYGYLHAI